MKNKYISLLEKEIQKFKDKHVDTSIINQFLKKVSSTDKVTKELNIDEHICSFFVPIDKESKSIYLVHHIKANDWIPPGGHIRFNEHPVDTVIREFEEELNYQIYKKQVELFNLSIKDISKNPRNPCKIHYDFWYLIDVPKVNFRYLKKEFYNAYWHPLNEKTYKKIKTPQYNKIIRTLKKIL